MIDLIEKKAINAAVLKHWFSWSRLTLMFRAGREYERKVSGQDETHAVALTEQVKMAVPRGLPDVRSPDLKRACELALELGLKSTHVVGWYSHRYGDSRSNGRATVRGPFCRWFEIHEGGGWYGPKRPHHVADAGDDADFCAHAMNNVEAIAQAYLLLREATEKDNPALVMAVDWKNKAVDLQQSILELSDANSKKFNGLVDLSDKCEKLKEENDLLRRNCRLAEG